MTEYLFLPVPTAEMTELATEILDAYKKAGNTPPTIVRNYFDSGRGKGVARALGLGCLRAVAASDRLYLLLHGAGEAGSKSVGANRNLVKSHERGLGVWKPGPGAKDLKLYGPADVARVLEAEGLTKSFNDLVLLCCGAGLAGGKDPLYAKSIVERVFDAMKALGFNHIKVTGYLGDVRAGAGDSYKVEVKEGGGARLVLPGEAFVTFQ
jgi:hypothetical protein